MRNDLAFFAMIVVALCPLAAAQETRSVADWQRRRAEIIENVQRVMGPLPSRERLPDLEVETLESIELPDGLVRRKIRFRSDRDSYVAAYLFVPSTAKSDPQPAVLCLHQTVSIGKGEPAGLGGSPNLHYALELTKRGFVTLAPDYPSFGEYDYDFAKHPEWDSGSLKGVWDNMRAIDLLQQLPEVAPHRIGCIGHSLGGHNAIFTALFDERIQVVVSSCGFTRFHKYYGGDLKGWTSARYMPRIATEYDCDPDRVPFDFPELIAALAPRAFFTSSPVRDDNFDCQGVRESITDARVVFELLNASEKLQAIYPESAHDFPPESRETAYRFIEKHLR